MSIAADKLCVLINDSSGLKSTNELKLVLDYSDYIILQHMQLLNYVICLIIIIT